MKVKECSFSENAMVYEMGDMNILNMHEKWMWSVKCMDLLETKARDLLQIILNRYHAARIYWEYGSKSQVLQQICRLENMGSKNERCLVKIFDYLCASTFFSDLSMKISILKLSILFL